MRDLVPHDRLERVVWIREDTGGKDHDISFAGRQSDNPLGNRRRALVVFGDERDANLGRELEPRTSEGIGEAGYIGVAYARGIGG
jgi:hypothetical protein